MSKSIVHVIEKAEEAAFFLREMEKASKNISPKGVIQFQYYFSAFVSAARSITFAMQCHCSEVDGFAKWYEQVQEDLRNDKTAHFFQVLRNEMQKEGRNPVTKGIVAEGPEPIMNHFFDYEILGIVERNAPEENVLSLCKKYLGVLIRVTEKLVDQFSDRLGLESAGLDLFERSARAMVKQVGMPDPELLLARILNDRMVCDTFRAPVKERIARLGAAFPLAGQG